MLKALPRLTARFFMYASIASFIVAAISVTAWITTQNPTYGPTAVYAMILTLIFQAPHTVIQKVSAEA